MIKFSEIINAIMFTFSEDRKYYHRYIGDFLNHIIEDKHLENLTIETTDEYVRVIFNYANINTYREIALKEGYYKKGTITAVIDFVEGCKELIEEGDLIC